MRLVWLMVAGALGAVARYELTLVVQRWLSGRGSHTFLAITLGTAFPLGTLIINVTGSFLLAFITTLALQEVIPPDLRLILGTGFLGAYTTFSTFEVESEALLSQGDWGPASVYILGNLILGFVAVLAGRALALRLLGLLPNGGTF